MHIILLAFAQLSYPGVPESICYIALVGNGKMWDGSKNMERQDYGIRREDYLLPFIKGQNRV